MEDEDIDVDAVIAEAKREMDKAREAEATAYAKGIDDLLDLDEERNKLRLGMTRVAIDSVCRKCGQAAKTRNWFNPAMFPDVAEGEVECIEYECICGHRWEGSTLEQYVEGQP
jgi:hypothetical protein